VDGAEQRIIHTQVSRRIIPRSLVFIFITTSEERKNKSTCSWCPSRRRIKEFTLYIKNLCYIDYYITAALGH
jgi:hypothetical protein